MNLNTECRARLARNRDFNSKNVPEPLPNAVFSNLATAVVLTPNQNVPLKEYVFPFSGHSLSRFTLGRLGEFTPYGYTLTNNGTLEKMINRGRRDKWGNCAIARVGYMTPDKCLMATRQIISLETVTLSPDRIVPTSRELLLLDLPEREFLVTVGAEHGPAIADLDEQPPFSTLLILALQAKTLKDWIGPGSLFLL